MNLESGSKEKNFEKKRKHYRLNCLWDIKYQVICKKNVNYNKDSVYMPEENCDKHNISNNSAETKKGNWLKGITTDISGGGCRFNSEEQQKKGDILIIKIKSLDQQSEEELFFYGRVIASVSLSNRKKTYENRIEFLELPFLEQEKLIWWIFEEKRRRKWQERSFDDEKKYFDY